MQETTLEGFRAFADLPLKRANRTIGMLSAMFTKPHSFSDMAIELLNALADQAAIAIENARLYSQTDQKLQRWMRALDGLERVSRKINDTLMLDDILPVIMEQAVRERAIADQDGELALPVVLGAEVIGVLSAQREGDGARVRWSDNELSIIRAAVDQLAQTVETLRLLDETQRSAARERAIGEVTGRVREELDIESMLRTAVDEIQRTLGADKVVVRMAPQAGDET